MGIERIPYWGWLPVGLIVGALFAVVYTEQPSDAVERIVVDNNPGRQDWEGGLLHRLRGDWVDSKGTRWPYIKNLRILPPTMGHDGVLVQQATFDFLKPTDPRAAHRGYVSGRAQEQLPFPSKTALVVTDNTPAFESIGMMLLDPHKKHRQPIEAKTLDDGQRALRRRAVDFVVCDMTISDQQVAKPLADQISRMSRKVPMIILAESGEEPLARDMVKQGSAVGYVLKGDKAAWTAAAGKADSKDEKTSSEGKAELGRLKASVASAVSPLIDKAFPDQTLRAEIEKLKVEQKALLAKDPKAVQVSYRYVWWAEDRARYAVWMAGGALVIGVIWPLVLWLLVGAGFGRAPEPKDERKYSSIPEPPKPVKVGMTDEDNQRLLDMEAEMEAKLAASGVAMTEAPQSEHEELTEGQIKTLSAGPLEAAKEEKPQEKKEYHGEYYPTATRVTKKP